MKIAVFREKEGCEILIFAVKGKEKNFSAIDGFENYFMCPKSPGDRDVKDYDVYVGHIGAGDALLVRTLPEVSFAREDEIEIDEDWFEFIDNVEVPKMRKTRKKSKDQVVKEVSQHMDNTLCDYTSKIPGFNDLPAEVKVDVLATMNDAVHEAFSHSSKST